MIITRYLTREVLNTFLTLTFVLLLSFLCQQSVRYLNYVASGKIPTNVLLQLISFEIPYLMALLLPLGLYLGILLAYGRLYAENEMSILRLSGFSHRQLLFHSLTVASVVAIGVVGLMLWVNPWISVARQAIMASDKATLHLIQTLIPGRFQVSANGQHVIFVERMTRNHTKAKNIFIAQRRQNSIDPWTLVLAKEGFQGLNDESLGQYFVTTEGHRYEGIAGQQDYKITQFKKYEIHIPKAEVHVAHEANEAMTTSALLADYQTPKHAAELQWRISIGILTFVLALMAVPLSTLKPRQSRYAMLIPAILIYIVYINLLLITRHWVEQNTIPVSMGLWWVHGLAIALLLLIGMVRLR